VILRAVKTQIDSRWTASERMHGDGALFEDLYASLDAAKNPLRNATMHPQQTYTMNESYDVIRSAGRFMQKLAARCDETVAPKTKKRRAKA